MEQRLIKLEFDTDFIHAPRSQKELASFQETEITTWNDVYGRLIRLFQVEIPNSTITPPIGSDKKDKIEIGRGNSHWYFPSSNPYLNTTLTIEEYKNRLAQYTSDEALQNTFLNLVLQHRIGMAYKINDSIGALLLNYAQYIGTNAFKRTATLERSKENGNLHFYSTTPYYYKAEDNTEIPFVTVEAEVIIKLDHSIRLNTLSITITPSEATKDLCKTLCESYKVLAPKLVPEKREKKVQAFIAALESWKSLGALTLTLIILSLLLGPFLPFPFFNFIHGFNAVHFLTGLFIDFIVSLLAWRGSILLAKATWSAIQTIESFFPPAVESVEAFMERHQTVPNTKVEKQQPQTSTEIATEALPVPEDSIQMLSEDNPTIPASDPTDYDERDSSPKAKRLNQPKEKEDANTPPDTTPPNSGSGRSDSSSENENVKSASPSPQGSNAGSGEHSPREENKADIEYQDDSNSASDNEDEKHHYNDVLAKVVAEKLKENSLPLPTDNTNKPPTPTP